jgi:hypothetical protein
VACASASHLVLTECHWWQSFKYSSKDYQALTVIPIDIIENHIRLCSDRELIEQLIAIIELYKTGDVVLKYEQDKGGECYYGYLLLRDCKLVTQVQVGHVSP